MFDWRHGRPEPGNGRILEVALQPVTPQGDGHSVAASPPKALECREWRPALRDKHELGCLGFPLQLPKGTQLKTGQLRCRRAPLDHLCLWVGATTPGMVGRITDPQAWAQLTVGGFILVFSS